MTVTQALDLQKQQLNKMHALEIQDHAFHTTEDQIATRIMKSGLEWNK